MSRLRSSRLKICYWLVHEANGENILNTLTYTIQTLVLAGLTVFTNSAFAHAHGHGSHHDHDKHSHGSHNHEQKAHEHGVAQMEFVIDKQNILLAVNSPLYNLLGFEHKPKLAEQKQAVKLQLKNIRNGDLVSFNPEAKCKVLNIISEQPFDTETHSHDHHDHQHKHDDNHKGHKDIRFEYELYCEAPDNLKTLDSSALFSAWKNLQTLRVQWIGGGQQNAISLDREKTKLSLK